MLGRRYMTRCVEERHDGAKTAKEKKNRPSLPPVLRHCTLYYSTPRCMALPESFGSKLGWGCPAALRSRLVIINQLTTTRTGTGKGTSLVRIGGPTCWNSGRIKRLRDHLEEISRKSSRSPRSYCIITYIISGLSINSA